MRNLDSILAQHTRHQPDLVPSARRDQRSRHSSVTKVYTRPLWHSLVMYLKNSLQSNASFCYHYSEDLINGMEYECNLWLNVSVLAKQCTWYAWSLIICQLIVWCFHHFHMTSSRLSKWQKRTWDMRKASSSLATFLRYKTTLTTIELVEGLVSGLKRLQKRWNKTPSAKEEFQNALSPCEEELASSEWATESHS